MKTTQGSQQKNNLKGEKPSESRETARQEADRFGLLVEPPASAGEKPAGKQKKEGRASKLLVAKKEKQKAGSFINLVDIALDGYDDIFSDFDSSPYSRRTLSMD